MPDAPNGPTTSSAVVAVICVVLVVALCLTGFGQWFFRYRRQSGPPTRYNPVLPVFRVNQPQTSEVQKQPQQLPTEDDLNKYLPKTDFKTWKGQQVRARYCLNIRSSDHHELQAFANGQKRADSIKPGTQDVITASTFDNSVSAPISPAGDPVHFSPFKGIFREHQAPMSDEPRKSDSLLKSSQPPDGIETYSSAAQQMRHPLASEIMFSDYICAICLSVIKDEVQVRGLPCGHAFHVDCVDSWLLWRRPCCPLCKASYQTTVGAMQQN